MTPQLALGKSLDKSLLLAIDAFVIQPVLAKVYQPVWYHQPEQAKTLFYLLNFDLFPSSMKVISRRITPIYGMQAPPVLFKCSLYLAKLSFMLQSSFSVSNCFICSFGILKLLSGGSSVLVTFRLDWISRSIATDAKTLTQAVAQ